MSNEDSKPKDTFDKANSSVSSLSTFVLMVIAVINVFIAVQSSILQEKTGAIQNQLEAVKNNAQTVELIEKLSDNLADSTVKKDIALIALNRKIADNDDKSQKMVTEIATQVYRTGIKDLITKSSSQEQNSSEVMKWTPEYKNTFVALAIIGERNPNLANTLIEELNEQKKELFNTLFVELDKQKYALSRELDKQIMGLDKSSEIYKNIKTYKNTNIVDKNEMEKRGIGDENAKIKFIEQVIEKMRVINPTKSTEQTKMLEQIKAIKQITGAFDFNIAIHYNDESQQENVENFNQYLKRQGYSTKEIFLDKGAYPLKNDKPISKIKYFHSGDQGQAENLKKILLDYVNLLDNQKWTNKFLISDADLLEFVKWDSPNGKIDIWLYFPPQQK
jgi:hypothetical protein